jgi:putative salt-induced outer membrane protein YdiY/small nuclear ribonucleoprotein (snRNP)-like protein
VRRSIWVSWMLCFFAGSVMADQVTLKNGDRLTGTIVKSDSKTLLIKTEFAGEVNVQWDAVSAMVSSQPLHMALKDGQTIVGTVTAADNKFDVATKETGPVTASKDAVAAMRDDAEQKAYDQQVERLRHPHLLDFWSGMVDTGLSLTRGNSDSLTYALASKAVRATERDKIMVYSDAIYAKSRVNGVSSTTAHSIRGGVRGDLNVSEKWFVFGFTDFEYDAFEHLDLRNVLGGGLGYHVVKTAKTTFDLFGGGDFEQEYFSPNPPTMLTSLTRKSAEIVVGEELNTKLNNRMTLSERFALYPNLSDTGNYRYQFDASASTKLKNWLSWQITFDDRFLSDPLPGLKKNDLLLTTGVRLTFGKGKF